MKIQSNNYYQIKSNLNIKNNPIKDIRFGASKKYEAELRQKKIQEEIREQIYQEALRKRELEEQIREKRYAEDNYKRYFFDSKKGRVTAEQCKDIIENHPITLTEAYKKVDMLRNIGGFKLEESPIITTKAAFNLKEYFDNNYDNYRIISIGTSPAPISQAMEYLGCDVVYVPISGMRHLDYSLVKKIMRNKNDDDESTLRNLNIILNYFKSKIPENDNKMNIILDYSCSGRTINGTTEFFKDYSGLNRDNFMAAPLDDTLTLASKSLSKDTTKLKYKIKKSDIEKIHSDCFQQRIEMISSVPHFDINDTINRMRMNMGEDAFYVKSEGKTEEDVFKRFEEFTSANSKAYSLCMYNELKKMGLV